MWKNPSITCFLAYTRNDYGLPTLFVSAPDRGGKILYLIIKEKNKVLFFITFSPGGY